MKQVIARFVLLVAVQCLVFVRAQNESASGFDPRLSQSISTGGRVTTTPRGSVGIDVVIKTQDVSIRDKPGFALRAASDHDLTLGICGFNNFNRFKTQSLIILPSPNHEPTSFGVRDTFEGDDVRIVCIRILNLYDNSGGEDLGGFPYVDAGGIGFDFVEMRFESPDGQTMQFRYELFAWETGMITTTPAPGGAVVFGTPRRNLLVLCYVVLIYECVFYWKKFFGNSFL